MPCPFFEPQQQAAAPLYDHARLPLIDEYEGLCHAGAETQAAPEDLRFRCCNHGYSRRECPSFPQSETRSALRYTVIRETSDLLSILCIEERDHIPSICATIEFDIATSTLTAGETAFIVRAQALAFCRSYTNRFLRPS